MNSLWPGLKFAFDWSNRELTYLDVKLIMTEGGILETYWYIMPTNPQLFLHYQSNHPIQVFKAIVYGQAITVKTVCSKYEFVTKHFKNLKEKFIERGYPIELDEENFRIGAALQRADLLKSRPAYPVNAVPPIPVKPKFKPTFIITYSPHNPNLRGLGRKTYFRKKNFRQKYE